MSQVLEVAEISMINGMERLNTISHNLANSSTTGYKKDVSVTQSFDNQMASHRSAVSNISKEKAFYKSHLPITHAMVDLQPGKLRETGNPLDFAIEGNGYLQVNTPHGVRYTRAGSLSLNASGQLVTSGGYPIDGLSGDIRLTTTSPRIDKNGVVWDGDAFLGQLKIVQFNDSSPLIKQGDGLFGSESAGQIANEFEGYQIHQGYVEASNVNMMNEMVAMIETMRQIESSQKVISAYDEMMSTALSTIAEV
ncbi:MAG: flagellar hook-basal body protein [Candidatus Sedimenticola sp. (ex Thyasira tokunagai)]